MKAILLSLLICSVAQAKAYQIVYLVEPSAAATERVTGWGTSEPLFARQIDRLMSHVDRQREAVTADLGKALAAAGTSLQQQAVAAQESNSGEGKASVAAAPAGADDDDDEIIYQECNGSQCFRYRLRRADFMRLGPGNRTIVQVNKSKSVLKQSAPTRVVTTVCACANCQCNPCMCGALPAATVSSHCSTHSMQAVRTRRAWFGGIFRRR